MVGDVIEARQTVRPRRLENPAPDFLQVHHIFAAAGAAPDHGQVRPWRLITVPASQRKNLADAFAQSLIERDPSATDDQVIRTREKALKAKGFGALFGLLAAEQAVCFINIGTVRSPTVQSRRPELRDFVSALEQSAEGRRDAVSPRIQQE